MKELQIWSCASASLEIAVFPSLLRSWFCRRCPSLPAESEYCDDSDSQTMNHLEQFRQDQRRDTLVSASGSSGSLCEAGQLERGFLKMLHDDDSAFP